MKRRRGRRPTTSRRSAGRAIHALALLAFLVIISPALSASPLGTAFTYQGRLLSGTNAASGSFDLQFSLYDAPYNANQLGSSLTNAAMVVTNGYFTVTRTLNAMVNPGGFNLYRLSAP